MKTNSFQAGSFLVVGFFSSVFCVVAVCFSFAQTNWCTPELFRSITDFYCNCWDFCVSSWVQTLPLTTKTG